MRKIPPWLRKMDAAVLWASLSGAGAEQRQSVSGNGTIDFDFTVASDPGAAVVALTAHPVLGHLGPTEGIDRVTAPSPSGARAITGHVRAAHLRVLSRLLQHASFHPKLSRRYASERAWHSPAPEWSGIWIPRRIHVIRPS